MKVRAECYYNTNDDELCPDCIVIFKAKKKFKFKRGGYFEIDKKNYIIVYTEYILNTKGKNFKHALRLRLKEVPRITNPL